jgi:hypothetical protein
MEVGNRESSKMEKKGDEPGGQEEIWKAGRREKRNGVNRKAEPSGAR